VLKRIAEGDVLVNVQARGEQLERALLSLEDRYPVVKGVRGKGLLRGLELHDEIAPDVVTAAMAHGLLANPVRPNVVRLMPPLTVTAEEIEEAVAIVEQALAAVVGA
jgi:acetylornithine/succinyldiaminopimelate/putrescine aminotransferase